MNAGRTLVILQSNYIPWRGYFDLIACCDEFMLFDEVQYTRRDWRNRNAILLNGARHLLTIPVQTKGRYDAPIDAIEVADPAWAQKHFGTIVQAYRRAPYFQTYAAELEAAYAAAAEMPLLTQVNRHFLALFCRWLDIATPFGDTRDVPRHAQTPTDRLVEICRARGAGLYVSGPAARAYIAPERFAEAGIALAYADYGGYAPYPQLGGAEVERLSMLDALMMCGPDARRLLKSLTPGLSLWTPESPPAQ